VKGKFESDGDDSENPPDFRFAKNCRILITFRFGFDLDTSLLFLIILECIWLFSSMYGCDQTEGYERIL